MADLDDFFAKKDRNKSKGKKFMIADEIAKKLDESGKRTEKSKKGKLKVIVGQDGEDLGVGNREEDDWKDFEEEKKDYKGLKIQNLTLIENKGYDEGTDDYEMEENEAGELVPKRKLRAGPWKDVSQPQVLEEIPEKRQEDFSTKEGSRSYVSPHVRNLAQQKSHHVESRLKSKAAPDVYNEELFPILSAAKNAEPAAGAWSKKKLDDRIGFEKVRNSRSHSSRYSETAVKMTPGKLTLGNKYGALTPYQN